MRMRLKTPGRVNILAGALNTTTSIGMHATKACHMILSFVDANQLLKDFFADVDKTLEAHREG